VSGIKDHSSDLKMGIGTGGVIGGTVFLCKETVKAKAIMDEYREAKDGLKDKELRNLKLRTAGKIVVNYLPGAILEGAGLASMWSGYSDVKAAFVGIGIAYSGLQEFVDKYREGVRETYGEEADEKLAYQFRTEEVVVQDENGEEHTETVRIYPHDASKMPSQYARYFCYGEADGAERSHEYNGKFLGLQQDLMNGYFRAHKKFMLNDCYDMLGIKRSKAGNHVGWVYDPNAPVGDNDIDLRIREVYREKFDSAGNPDGWERVWMIDPNVDGMVEDKMVRLGLMDE
jgi:hypothetical protein